MVPFMRKQIERTIVMCAIGWSLIGMKQFYMPFTNIQKSVQISTVKLLLVLSIVEK